MLDTSALIAATASSRLQELDAVLAPFNRTDSPGVIAAVALHGQVLYRKAVGMASLEHGVANTPCTRVRIASTSKHFTGIAIMLLVEDGLIKLDDPMQRYLPEFPVLGAPGPTVRQLLNHTSGWRAHDEIWSMAQGLAFSEPGAGVPAMARQSALNFEPGTRMAYSNGGYHLLATIIERVSGKRYNDFLTERLFMPLNMPDTESIETDHDVSRGLADRYVAKAGGGWKHGVYPCEMTGGGSLASTADDMLRWLAHLRSDTKIVGRPESWAALSEPMTLASGAQVDYGFGLISHAYRGVRVVHHAGAVLGATSQMLTVPAHGLDIVILVNGAPINPGELANRIVEWVLEEVLPEPHAPRPAAADYPALVGRTYVSQDSGGVIAFAAQEDRLALSWQSSAAMPMHHADGRLWIGMREMPINDIALQSAAIAQAQAPAELDILEGGDRVRYTLIAQPAPGPAELAPQLCGSYHSPDLDADASVALVDGTLLLSLQGRHGRQVGRLEPLSADVLTFISCDAAMARLGNKTVYADRDAASGAVTGLRISSPRIRNVRLHRLHRP